MSKHHPRKASAPAAQAPAPDLSTLQPEPRAETTALAVSPDDDDEDDSPTPYDPADYRWVPVRRRPRYDGWTEEKQRRFIETLADTGLVNVAAKAVGLTRAGAYQLRRSPHGAAFARAWDAARHHAAGLIEDIAWERAIEGTEQEVLDRNGQVAGTRLVHDNRLLQYLLSHLKPERYGRARRSGPAPREQDHAGAMPSDPVPAAPMLADTLRAMEPRLPAPAEQLLDADTLQDELELADVADGALPTFLNEQRQVKSDKRVEAEAFDARYARGKAAFDKSRAGGKLTPDEFADECFYFDPIGNKRTQPRRRQGTG